MNLFDDLKNNLDFFLRCRITLSRKNYSEKPADKTKIFTNPKQEDLYNYLNEKYNLSIIDKYNNINLLTNLYYLEIFDKYISPANNNASILDIGSKNWNYAGSEYIFFNKFTSNFVLNGIELDAYRLCTNLFNRYEIAKFYTKHMKNTRYIAGDFLMHNQKYDYIIWILPFITEFPHQKWGLPMRYFRPEQMLSHAYNLLNANGELLIINQGEKEFEIQKELNKKLNLEYKDFGEIEDNFDLFQNKRFCSKIIKR